MNRTSPSFRSLKFGSAVGALSFLITFFVPLAFYCLFGLMPFSGDTMWGVTEVLWAPLKLLVEGLSSLLSLDLWKYVNALYAAPFVNALLGALFGFGMRYCYTRFRSRGDLHDG